MINIEGPALARNNHHSARPTRTVQAATHKKITRRRWRGLVVSGGRLWSVLAKITALFYRRHNVVSILILVKSRSSSMRKSQYLVTNRRQNGMNDQKARFARQSFGVHALACVSSNRLKPGHPTIASDRLDLR